MSVRAVSLDFGEVLVRFDESCLCEKLAQRGFQADSGVIAAALPAARAEYDALIATGRASHPWKPFMRALLQLSGAVPGEALDREVDFLFRDQRRCNLWRKPVPGMFELCRELSERAVPVAILSNSEGRAHELAEELGLLRWLRFVMDSGVVGVAKPDARIFRLFAEKMGVHEREIVHVGDSLEADVRGAIAAGMRAIWFMGRRDQAPEGVVVAADASELRVALTALLG